MIELLPFSLLVMYLIPFLIAAARNHDVLMTILVMNLLIGWTGIGWVAVLIFAIWSPSSGGPVRSSSR